MTTFYVGQRVRIISWWSSKDVRDIPIDGVQHIGSEAVINELSCTTGGRVAVGVGVTINGDDNWVAPSWGLEPIIPEGMSALESQVGGDHYRGRSIQPVQYIEANALGFLEGCVIKRLTRHAHPTGKGRQDIEKAIHELQLLLELRYPE